MRLRSTLVILFLIASLAAIGQTQLVLFNRDKILIRYEYGDDIVYKLKNSKEYKTESMLGATEFAMITFSDTVPFAAIDRISLTGHPQHSAANLISKFLITLGVAYFVIDQFNHVVVQGQKADLEPTVWKPSLVLVTSGYALKLLKKRSVKIRYPARLVTAGYGTPFYKSEQ